MGGADAVLAKAQGYFDRGDYRWVAQVVNHVVFADPTNTAARELQAAALEQMGYQAEATTWRNAYLMGAKELREGTPDWGRIPTRDMSHAMQASHLFDIIGVRFDPAVFTAGPVTINVHFTDLGEDHVLGLGRSAIHHRPDVIDADALDAAEIYGDGSLVHNLFASLTVFSTAAIIEP